jgi:hypothetical protein
MGIIPKLWDYYFKLRVQAKQELDKLKLITNPSIDDK